MIKTILFVGLGGAIGSVLRYLTAIVVNKYWSTHFPLATMLTNIVGCFLIGVLVGFLEKHNLSDGNLKWFLITGVCGGYTTFSAFGLENVSLFENQQSLVAFLYIGLSIFLGIMSVWLGLFLLK